MTTRGDSRGSKLLIGSQEWRYPLTQGGDIDHSRCTYLATRCGLTAVSGGDGPARAPYRRIRPFVGMYEQWWVVEPAGRPVLTRADAAAAACSEAEQREPVYLTVGVGEQAETVEVVRASPDFWRGGYRVMK